MFDTGNSSVVGKMDSLEMEPEVVALVAVVRSWLDTQERGFLRAISRIFLLLGAFDS